MTGKVGTDIEENKCTWLIVQALARANDEQRAVLEVGAIDLTIIVAAYFNNQFILSYDQLRAATLIGRNAIT